MADAIFYQIFPDRFGKSVRVSKSSELQEWGSVPTTNGFMGGDLLGVVEKLDYLSELGVNALYLNPIFSSTANHRYHTHDYFAVDPLLGGMEAFRELLKECHARGIRVTLDAVLNHASRSFLQFNHLLENGAESPYRNWFLPKEWPLNAYDESQGPNYEAWWGLHALPKFNIDNPEVREFLFSVAEYWVREGIDGWRFDVPGEIQDLEFWRELHVRVRAINPDVYLVGEFWQEAQDWLKGDIFDGQMNYMFARAAIGFLGVESEGMVESGHPRGPVKALSGMEFGAELERQFVQLFDQSAVLSQLTILSSHDTPRLLSVFDGDTRRDVIAQLVQIFVPGAPCIYYGAEIGMVGGHDPLSRGAFPENPSLIADGTGLFRAIQSAIALRHESAALRKGDFRIVGAESKLMAFTRSFGDESALVAVNGGESPAQLDASGLASRGLKMRLVEGEALLEKDLLELGPFSIGVWLSG